MRRSSEHAQKALGFPGPGRSVSMGGTTATAGDWNQSSRGVNRDGEGARDKTPDAQNKVKGGSEENTTATTEMGDKLDKPAEVEQIGSRNMVQRLKIAIEWIKIRK